jgi:hypothetical protein
MNRRKRLWLAPIVAIAAVVGWMQYATHDVPAGQSALTRLDSAAMNVLKAEFNGAAAETRIITLLSPT